MIVVIETTEYETFATTDRTEFETWPAAFQHVFDRGRRTALQLLRDGATTPPWTAKNFEVKEAGS